VKPSRDRLRKVVKFSAPSWSATHSVLARTVADRTSRSMRDISPNAAGGESTALWRLPYDDCKDCHKDPHSEGE